MHLTHRHNFSCFNSKPFEMEKYVCESEKDQQCTHKYLIRFGIATARRKVGNRIESDQNNDSN